MSKLEEELREMKYNQEKIKYHQKMLLHIATHEDPDEVLFFQQIISYDLDEKQVDTIIKLLCILAEEPNEKMIDEDIKYFKELGIELNQNALSSENVIGNLKLYLEILKIEIPLKYLLLSLKRQHIQEETCINLLKKL
ncbi:hypothetical protein ABEV54_20010 [Peribacillus psychrosaccharolyticus]|uniref:DUF1878 family protein n=1 Tax=Peribacillus psychrosaccharolyticus TaxID=1407 RepID=UPI003D2BB591